MYFCKMQNLLIEYILKENLLNKGDKVLLAVSGGIDSVFMADIFSKTDYHFGIAHCNFGLRGKESDEDAVFVESLAKRYNVPFHIMRCDAANYAKENKVSIQMAARDLRFSWFEDLCISENYAVYATAHHADDAIETYFINQLRGTGIAGLHGLKPKNGKLIHPLLFTQRKQIEAYAIQNKLNYREDSSNKTVKYLRNKLRHNLLPVLDEIQSNYRDLLMQNMRRFSATEQIYLQKIEQEKQNVCHFKEDKTWISITKLKKLPETSTYLYEYIKSYGFVFSDAEEIIESIENGHSGARFYSTDYVLLRDRKYLIISLKHENSQKSFELNSESGEIFSPIHLKWETFIELKFEKELTSTSLDFDKLKFPLILRKWEKGDFFYPLGMQSKKLLSDFFIDIKLNQLQKEVTWLLVSENKIAWIIGHRIDNRFRISEHTQKVLKLKLYP